MVLSAPVLLTLWLLQFPYAPPEIRTVVPPAHPAQTVEGGEVAFEAQVNRQGTIERLLLRLGRAPFAQSATEAVSQWTFMPARGEAPPVDKVGIFVLFRRRALFTAGPTRTHYDWSLPEDDRAALPADISYPRYPANTVAEGVVILQLVIAPNGAIESMRTIRDIPPLTNAAEEAVREWTFSPARSDGQSVRGAVIVAVSFQRPFVQPPPQRNEN